MLSEESVKKIDIGAGMSSKERVALLCEAIVIR